MKTKIKSPLDIAGYQVLAMHSYLFDLARKMTLAHHGKQAVFRINGHKRAIKIDKNIMDKMRC